jgi:osmotically-inducible protein OsmY
MSFLSKWFGGSANKYDDAELISQSMAAITADPLIKDPAGLVVTSKQGVVTISGIVQRRQEKERIEGVVRTALTTKGLKQERIINDLHLPAGA